MSIGPVSRALHELRAGDHLCLIYTSPEEHLAVASAYLSAGLEENERCLYVVDDATASVVEAALDKSGISVGEAVASRRLEIVTKKEAYLRDGYFSPDRMIEFLRERTDQAKRNGHRALRLAAEMTWALGDEQGVDKLVEYEARLNHFFKDHDCLAVCQYNKSRFPATTTRAIVYTHPHVVHGSTFCRNPFYIPPDEYLCDSEERAEVELDRLLRQLQALQQSQEALVHSESLVAAGRLAATISHEINNPLEAVMNLLYLAEHSSDPTESRRFINSANEELKRVAHITRQSLAFYRDSGGPAEFALAQTVSEVCNILERELTRKQVRVIESIAPDIKVIARKGEVRQVLVNLVSNAVDALAANDNGRIDIRAVLDGNNVCLTVADNGHGIAPGVLPRIFEPFFTTKESKGTGLGLWVVQDLVARQGGTLHVSSQSKGPQTGTTFTIYLPAPTHR